MSMARVRKLYCVPAKRGMRVRYSGGGKFSGQVGTITGTVGSKLLIRIDGYKISHIFHPTWELEYLNGTKP